MDEAMASVECINGIFMEARGNTESQPATPLHEKISRVYQLVQILKARAGELKLAAFEREIHAIEYLLNDFRRSPNPVNEDLLTVLVSLSDFQKKLSEATDLIKKISKLRHSVGSEDTAAFFADEDVQYVPASLSNLERRLSEASDLVEEFSGSYHPFGADGQDGLIAALLGRKRDVKNGSAASSQPT